LALVLLFSSAPAGAQVLYGSFIGDVRDASEAAVPMATVKITNIQTGLVRTFTTDAAGLYLAPTIPAGEYRIEVSKEGFRMAVEPGVTVTVNTQVRVNFRLEVGAITERIEVVAVAANLQTDRAEVRSEMTSKQLTEIPVPGARNYQALFLTLPGISPPGTPHSIPSNPSRSMDFSVNGANTASNNTRIDGASAFNVWLPHISSYVPALESIETVNIVTNSFDAEQGLAGGAATNVIVRSGTNEHRGALFHYHQGNWSQARNFFLPAHEGIPKFVGNQFGGRLGGPIIKNKLFYFGSYEGTLNRQTGAALYNVPTPAMRRGDLSEQLGFAPGIRSVVVDPLSGPAPATRTPFPGNIIPPHRIHPLSARLMGIMPQENLPSPVGLPVLNFFGAGAGVFDRHTLDTKVNYNISDKWTAFGRLSFLDFHMLAPVPFGEAFGPPIIFGNPGVGGGRTWTAAVGSTYTVSPNFIIDGNFGYTLMGTGVEQPGLGPNTGRDVFRIPGTNGTRYFESGWPGFAIGGQTSFGSTTGFMPYWRNDPQYQYVANANWQKGSHNIRFGMDYFHQQLNHTQPEMAGAAGSAAGLLSFGSGPTQRGPVNTMNSMGTYLLGLITGGGRILQVPDVYRTRTNMFSLYFRDQWQVNRRLTINIGARFESFPMPWREGGRGMERYDFATNEMIACGLHGNPRDCGTSGRPLYMSPRVGVAYRLDDKTVIRSGFGMNWDPWNLARPLRTNFPVLAAFNFVPPAFQWASTFDLGIPMMAEPALDARGRVPMPLAFAVNTTDDRFHRSYIMNWNFMIQRDLGRNFVTQVGYVGTRAVNVSGMVNHNAGQVPGMDLAGMPLFGRFGRRVVTNINDAMGHTSFHSLQATLTKRFSSGLQANVAYTWSKAIGICCNMDNNGGPLHHAWAFYDRNRTLLPMDRTHNLQITATYELPFGQGRAFNTGKKLIDGIIGGWQLNGVFSGMSGLPFNVTADGATLLMPGNQQTPDQIVPVVGRPEGIGRGHAYFDRDAFREVPMGANRFGNMGPMALRGPNFWNSDLGLFRTFQISERSRMEFRAEMFNWTNTPKFANPVGSINAADFMFVMSTVAGGREPNGDRILRLGLRLTF
jgi:hypothetical protein